MYVDLQFRIVHAHDRVRAFIGIAGTMLLHNQEKEELLRNLAGYKDKADADRARQLELARLKREQRKVREEEKFSAAALFISVAKEQEKE